MADGPIVHSEGGGIGCMGCLATLWFIAYPVLFVLLPALGGATGGAGGAFAGALGSVALAGLFWPWLIGLFVLGLLALVTRPRQRLEVRLPAQQIHSARPVELAPSTKACPMCAETVMVAARICRYCGHQFGEPSHEPVEALAQAVAPPSLPGGGGATRLAEPVALAATQAARPGDSSPLPDARVPAGLITAVRWPRLSRRAWAAGVALVLVAAIVFFAATTLLASRQETLGTGLGPFVPDPSSSELLNAQEHAYLYQFIKPCPRAGCETATPDPRFGWAVNYEDPIPAEFQPCLTDPDGAACYRAVMGP
jgi:hypothetical protein